MPTIYTFKRPLIHVANADLRRSYHLILHLLHVKLIGHDFDSACLHILQILQVLARFHNLVLTFILNSTMPSCRSRDRRRRVCDQTLPWACRAR